MGNKTVDGFKFDIIFGNKFHLSKVFEASLITVTISLTLLFIFHPI